MKAILSTTYSDTYLFFLPIVTYCWNKLGVDVICFAPKRDKFDAKSALVFSQKVACEIHFFECPEHKEATYAQCSRLFAACLPIEEDERLVISDIDMGVFSFPFLLMAYGSVQTYEYFKDLPIILGSDLVPEGQLPMCYITCSVKGLRELLSLSGKTCQEMLDLELGEIECENFRGNMWARDQEIAFKYLNEKSLKDKRARPGTQFAANRVDRDDINWRSYLGPDLIDAHLWRPGYMDENFTNIMELLQTQYPEDNFQWLIDYRDQYIQLL